MIDLSLGGCQGPLSTIIRAVEAWGRKITFRNLKDLSDLSGFLAFIANKFNQTLFKTLLGLCSNFSLTQLFLVSGFWARVNHLGELSICKIGGI